MENDMRKKAVIGSLIKDNTLDWKNIANKEIEDNKSLRDKIDHLEKKISYNDEIRKFC